MIDRGPVLIVEDDTDARRLMAERMHADGYRTVEAASGEEALRLARRERPCLVLLDLVLPGMDGWECLHALRELEGRDGVPVVVVSILDPAGEHEAVDGYVMKPFRAARLETVVRSIVASNNEEQERAR